MSSAITPALAATPSTSVQPNARGSVEGANKKIAPIPSTPAPATNALMIVCGKSSGLCHRSRPSHWLNSSAV